MPDDNPFKLNRSRVIILIFAALALITALASIAGGLAGYQQVKEVVKAPANTTQSQ